MTEKITTSVHAMEENTTSASTMEENKITTMSTTEKAKVGSIQTTEEVEAGSIQTTETDSTNLNATDVDGTDTESHKMSLDEIVERKKMLQDYLKTKEFARWDKEKFEDIKWLWRPCSGDEDEDENDELFPYKMSPKDDEEMHDESIKDLFEETEYFIVSRRYDYPMLQYPDELQDALTRDEKYALIGMRKDAIEAFEYDRKHYYPPLFKLVNNRWFPDYIDERPWVKGAKYIAFSHGEYFASSSGSILVPYDEFVAVYGDKLEIFRQNAREKMEDSRGFVTNILITCSHATHFEEDGTACGWGGNSPNPFYTFMSGMAHFGRMEGHHGLSYGYLGTQDEENCSRDVDRDWYVKSICCADKFSGWMNYKTGQNGLANEAIAHGCTIVEAFNSTVELEGSETIYYVDPARGKVKYHADPTKGKILYGSAEGKIPHDSTKE